MSWQRPLFQSLVVCCRSLADFPDRNASEICRQGMFGEGFLGYRYLLLYVRHHASVAHRNVSLARERFAHHTHPKVDMMLSYANAT